MALVQPNDSSREEGVALPEAFPEVSGYRPGIGLSSFEKQALKLASDTSKNGELIARLDAARDMLEGILASGDFSRLDPTSLKDPVIYSRDLLRDFERAKGDNNTQTMRRCVSQMIAYLSEAMKFLETKKSEPDKPVNGLRGKVNGVVHKLIDGFSSM